MRCSFRGVLIPVVAVLWATSSSYALEAIKERADQGEYVRSVQKIFEQEDFPQLEKIAAELFRDKSRYTDGTWKLASFYAALAPTDVHTDWPAWLARFERWEGAVPASVVARTTHARALVSYGWAARGSGYANTVSDEGGKRFEERLRAARTMLDSDPVLKKDFGYYYAMLPVALGQGWPHDQEEKLFNEAVLVAPDFEGFYFSRVTFLLEKWYGSSADEWHNFALAAAESTQSQHGMTFYTRIVWSALGIGMAKIDDIRAAKVDWPRLRQGFEDIAREYPDSLWNKNAFCFYAYVLNDRVTARRLFAQLKGRYAREIWGSEATFERIESWASSETPSR